MPAAKKYALLPMGEEDLGPAKVVEKKKEKRRHRDKSPSRREKHTRERSPERSPRRDSEHRPRKLRRREENDADLEDRWGDEEYVSEEDPEFQESATKRIKTDHVKDEEDGLSEGERERRKDQAEKDAFARGYSPKMQTSPRSLLKIVHLPRMATFWRREENLRKMQRHVVQRFRT